MNPQDQQDGHDNKQITQNECDKKQPSRLLRWLFGLCVFVTTLVLIVRAALIYECGIGIEPSGSWCGAGTLYTVPYWGPFVLLGAAALAYILSTGSISARAMGWFMTVVALIAAAIVFVPIITSSFEEKKTTLSYEAYNHTDQHIVSIVINGEGGVLAARAHGEGGGVCCVILPKRWRPGLMATIKWQLDGDWLKDEQGKEVIRNGKKVLVPGPWKEKTVDIPKYAEKDMGHFDMHFYPDDTVRVVIAQVYAGHPKYPPMEGVEIDPNAYYNYCHVDAPSDPICKNAPKD